MQTKPKSKPVSHRGIYIISQRFENPLVAFRKMSSEFRKRNPIIFNEQNENLQVSFIESIEGSYCKSPEKIPVSVLDNIFSNENCKDAA
jgi:hypothetical protein